MKTTYSIHCIWCGEFLKNIRAKEKIQLECQKCGQSFLMSPVKEKSPDVDGFDIEITILVKSEFSGSGDRYNGMPRPEKEILFLDQNELFNFPLQCIFCKRSMKGKESIKNSIESVYSCNHCKNNYYVSFMTKEIGGS